ncbi:MAG: T9SS type A sorting domain-containing protein [Bacteroidales bacterium]|nr:T9SS type A sorting domain-containing protein [Bacteroidales bacterium]
MKFVIISILFFFILKFDAVLSQQHLTTYANFEQYVRFGQILHDNSLLLKSSELLPDDQVFEINAEYSGSDCDGKLTSFSVVNAQFPLTWHELDQDGNIIRSDLNLTIEDLRNNTTYIVEDKTKHTDTVFIQLDRSVGINKIFPNPAIEFIWIEFRTRSELEVFIQIFDLNGKLLLKKEAVASQKENNVLLNMPDLEKGLYLVKVKAHCIDETRKVIYLDQ